MLAKNIVPKIDFDVNWVEVYNRQGNDRIIVIGSGPVGMRIVENILKYNHQSQIAIFGNEPCAPYNRVQLSSLLAGDISREQINIALPLHQEHPNFRFYSANIINIDRVAKTVIDANGGVYDYDMLVIATGAHAHMPNIPGIDQQGVYRFRTLADTELLFARIARSRHVVVAGGGLLGLEAAKALMRPKP